MLVSQGTSCGVAVGVGFGDLRGRVLVLLLALLLEIIVVDRFYIALFSAFEQTHCARM